MSSAVKILEPQRRHEIFSSKRRHLILSVSEKLLNVSVSVLIVLYDSKNESTGHSPLSPHQDMSNYWQLLSPMHNISGILSMKQRRRQPLSSSLMNILKNVSVQEFWKRMWLISSHDLDFESKQKVFQNTLSLSPLGVILETLVSRQISWRK